jgi:hypothetical protein
VVWAEGREERRGVETKFFKIRAASPEPGAVEPEPAGKWIGGRRHARGGNKFRAGANCQSGDRQCNCEGSELAHAARLSEIVCIASGDCRSEISRQAIAKVSASDERAGKCWIRRAASTQTTRISFSSTRGELISAGALGGQYEVQSARRKRGWVPRGRTIIGEPRLRLPQKGVTAKRER